MDDVCEGKDFCFPAEEERVLRLWEGLDAFREQVRRTAGGEDFVSYDGPPFATGLPHYGHLLAGTIKDVVTRHQSMRGRDVARRFGWDCHGVPVEFEVDGALGITTRAQVLQMGIAKYNEACRGIVTKYVAKWEAVVTCMRRWVDFSNGYKTMDIDFMESVWWVFAQLWEKDLVYKGFKVMPFSTAKTVLLNFEAAKDYRTVSGPYSDGVFPYCSEMVVVHPDNDFLEDITGRLREYVMDEMNIKTITPCNDPLMYASLCAEPNFSVLDKILRKDMGKVSNEVKKMTQEQILVFVGSGEIIFFGHCLKLDDIKIVREFKCPADVLDKDIGAAGDSDALVILDLRLDPSLFEAGVAREVVSRIQKLRKTAQLKPTDTVDIYYRSQNNGENSLENILQSQYQYIADGCTWFLTRLEVICEEARNVHGMSFVIYVARKP